MYRLQCNLVTARRYGFLCLMLFGLCLKAEALAQGTWTRVVPNPTPGQLESVYFISATEGWASGNGTVLHTTDGGLNWTPQTVPVSPLFAGLFVRFFGALNGWTGGGPSVLSTSDGGATWVDFGADTNFVRSALFATSATTAWSATLDGGNGDHYFTRYTLGSPNLEQHFDFIPAGPQFFDIFFVNPDEGWSVGSNGLITRITNGSTATPVFTPQTSSVFPTFLYGIYMVDATTGYVVGEAGTIVKTVNGGATWVEQDSGTTNDLNSVHCIDVDRCWAVGPLGIPRRTINGGASPWTAEPTNNGNDLVSVFMVSADVGYAVGASGAVVKYTGPTSVTLESFTASADANGEVYLNWKTGYEVGNLGFNIYREQGGRRARLTPQILAGSALLAGTETGLTAGASYEWLDELQPWKGETRYWLEELDINGQSIWHGPAPIEGRINSRKDGRRKTVVLSSLGRTQRSSTGPVETKAKLRLRTQDSMGTTLANLGAVKLSINREGWYRVSQEELVRAGLNANVDPRGLQLYVDGSEQRIVVSGEEDGRFDPADGVEFYGTGLDSASSDTRIYWLAEGVQAGRRLQRARPEGRRVSVSSFPYTVERRDRTVYFASLLNGEDENFFGAVVGKESVDQSIDLPNLDVASSQRAVIEVSLQGVTLGEHRVRVLFNGDELGNVVFDGKSQGRGRFLVSHSRLKETDNQIRLAAHASERDISLVDAIRVTYWHRYSADDDYLKFILPAGGEALIDGFSSGEIRVFDITDTDDLRTVMGRVKRQGKGFSVRVAAPGSGARTLLAFTDRQTRRAAATVRDRASSWLETTKGADLVIVTHSDFIDTVSPLRARRESQGLIVAVADVEDIYDEFSYGQKTPQAIKDFLQFAKTNWQRVPKFVLLVGDASLDPKNYKGIGNYDFVPTKLIDTELMETASDEWFSDFEGLPEMAIGRLPVATREEADRVIGKILSFEQSDSTGGALLVSDSADAFDFKGASDELRQLLPSDMVVEEILRNPTGDGTEKSRLLASLNRGNRIVNYLGHGSVGIWRGNLLTQADVEGLTNSEDLTLFVATTCLNGYFLEPGYDSLAESLMKADGGACAVWASSGMTGPTGQALVNKELFRLLFRAKGHDGRSLTLGEATTVARTAAETNDIRRTYILFGDPTMKLR